MLTAGRDFRHIAAIATGRCGGLDRANFVLSAPLS
jgi:hypothetical protein